MFCPDCGTQAVEGAKFCAKCGRKLPAGASVEEQRADAGVEVTGKDEATTGALAREKKEAPKKEAPKKEAPKGTQGGGLLSVVYVKDAGSKAVPGLNYVFMGIVPKGIENPFGRVDYREGARAGEVGNVYAWLAGGTDASGRQWPKNIVVYPKSAVLKGQRPQNQQPLVLAELTNDRMTLLTEPEYLIRASRTNLSQPVGAGCTIEWREVQTESGLRRLPFCLCKPEGTLVVSKEICPICGKPTGYVPKVEEAGGGKPAGKAPDAGVVTAAAALIKGMASDTAASELAKMAPDMRAAVEAKLGITPQATAPKEEASAERESLELTDLEIAVVPAEQLPVKPWKPEETASIEEWAMARAAGNDIMKKAAAAAELNPDDPESALPLVKLLAAVPGAEVVVFPTTCGPAEQLPVKPWKPEETASIEEWAMARAAGNDIMKKAAAAAELNPDDPESALPLVNKLATIPEGAIEVLPTKIVPLAVPPEGYNDEKWRAARQVKGQFINMMALAAEWAADGEDPEVVYKDVKVLSLIEESVQTWRPSVEDVKRAKGLLKDAPVAVVETTLPAKSHRWTSNDLAELFGNKCRGYGGHTIFTAAHKAWGSEPIGDAAGHLVFFAAQGLEALMKALPEVREYYEAKPQKRSGGNTVAVAIVAEAEKAGIEPIGPCAERDPDPAELAEAIGKMPTARVIRLCKDVGVDPDAVDVAKQLAEAALAEASPAAAK